MPQFEYQGVDKSGKRVSGKLEAKSEGDLRMQLRKDGIRPTRITKPRASGGGGGGGGLASFFKSRVIVIPLPIIVNFTRQLQVLISSGIPLIQGLEILSEQTQSAEFKLILVEVGSKVSQGAFLWESLSAYPGCFPKLYVSLIRAGEASGALDQMLKRLTRYLEDSDRIARTIKGAMTYPIIVISIGFAVVGGMVVFVIPKFEEMLKGSGKELPAPTQFLIDVSHKVIDNIYPISIFIVVGGFFLTRYLKSEEGKAFMDRITFRLPVFGMMAQKGGVARFTRTMQTLLASGVSLLDAIEICRSTINNVVLEQALAKIKNDVEGGKTLGMVLGTIPVFPKMAVQMIAIGESTGNLDRMLERVADLYESEVEEIAGSLGKLIEPFVIVFLGTMVGGIMIAMYLPVFQMAGGAE